MTSIFRQKENFSVEEPSGVTLESLLFYVYFALMVGAKGLGIVDGTPVYKALLVVSSLLILCKLLIGKHRLAEYGIVGALLLLGLVIWQIAGSQAPIICMFLLVGMKGVSLRHTFRVGAVVWSGTFLMQIITQLLNLRTRDFVIHNKFHLGYVIRWALGYVHPNVLFISYVVFVAYLFYVKQFSGKRLRKASLLALAGGAYIFLYSLSLTGTLFLLLFLLLCNWFDYQSRHEIAVSKVGTVLLNLIFPFCVCFSVLGPIVIRGRLFDIINKLMTTRFFLSRHFLTTYGLSPFGQDFSGLSHVWTLDCSYTNLLMYNGMIYFLVIMVLFVGMIRSNVNRFRENLSTENALRLSIIFSFLIAGVSEPFLFNNSFKNLTWLFAGAFFWEWMKRVGETDRRWNLTIPAWKCAGIEIGLKPLKAVQGALRDLKAKFFASMNRKEALLICVIAILSAAAGAGLYAGTAKLPTYVYALRSSCDTDESSVDIYLTKEEAEELREDPDTWLLSYTDPETPLLRFSGTIIQVEYIRGIVSGGLFAMLGAFLVSGIVISIRQKRTTENQM